MNKGGYLTEGEVLQRMLFENNVELVSKLLLELQKKHPQNKNLNKICVAFREMCVYTWSLQLDIRELNHKLSESKLKVNLMKDEFYNYEPIKKSKNEN